MNCYFTYWKDEVLFKIVRDFGTLGCEASIRHVPVCSPTRSRKSNALLSAEKADGRFVICHVLKRNRVEPFAFFSRSDEATARSFSSDFFCSNWCGSSVTRRLSMPILLCAQMAWIILICPFLFVGRSVSTSRSDWISFKNALIAFTNASSSHASSQTTDVTAPASLSPQPAHW